MTTGAHLVQAGQVGNDPQVCNATGVRDGGADVVDQLLLDEIFAVPYRVENLAHRQRCGGVMANELEGFLVLGGRRVF